MKKLLLSFLVFLFFNKVIAQKKEYFLKVSSGISYTFFRTNTDHPPGVSLSEPYAQKGPVGSFFNVELQIKKQNGLIYDYGFSQYLYQKNVNVSYGNNGIGNSLIGSLYQRTSYFHFGINKPYTLKKNDFISVGLGVNFAAFRNQTLSIRNIVNSFYLGEERTIDLGSQLQLRYEKEIKSNLRWGIETKLIVLIIPAGFYDLSIGPYLRVKL